MQTSSLVSLHIYTRLTIRALSDSFLTLVNERPIFLKMCGTHQFRYKLHEQVNSKT